MASEPDVTAPLPTDWTAYYRSVPAVARITRRFTARTLMAFLRNHAASAGAPRRVLEIGGANSCFAADLLREWPELHYHVADTNETGLAMFRERFGHRPHCTADYADVLTLAEQTARLGTFDVVYSVGLIEHFDVPLTRQAVASHFALAAPSGVVLVSYPTPTPLYRAARWTMERLGIWKFHDERPLARAEVLRAIPDGWVLRRENVLWPLVLTQRMMLFTAQGRASA